MLISHHIPRLGVDAVHVYHHTLDLDRSALLDCEAVLSEDEVIRAKRFKFEKDRNHFVAARGILRHLLGQYTHLAPAEVVFCYGQKGKPELELGLDALRFNMSHSHGMGMWAFTIDRLIGVDIEWCKRKVDVDAVGARFFSKQEWAYLKNMPETERRLGFFNCWTRKEAFVKALGDGLSFSLKSFDVSVAGDAKLMRVDGDVDVNQWTMRAFKPAPDYVGAVAFEREANLLYQPLQIDKKLS